MSIPPAVQTAPDFHAEDQPPPLTVRLVHIHGSRATARPQDACAQIRKTHAHATWAARRQRGALAATVVSAPPAPGGGGGAGTPTGKSASSTSRVDELQELADEPS